MKSKSRFKNDVYLKIGSPVDCRSNKYILPKSLFDQNQPEPTFIAPKDSTSLIIGYYVLDDCRLHSSPSLFLIFYKEKRHIIRANGVSLPLFTLKTLHYNNMPCLEFNLLELM